MRQRKLEKLGRAKRQRGKLGRACKRGHKLVVTATNTICKQVDRGGRSFRIFFQAFSISVLHSCGLKGGHKVSCTVYYSFELFRVRIMVSIGTLVFCYFASNVAIFSCVKKIEKMVSILCGFYLLSKVFLYYFY